MTCAKALERVFDYIDNSIDAGVTSEIESHIAQCLKCHGRFEFERLLKERIRKTSTNNVPGKLEQRIEELIAKHSAPKR